MHSNVAIATVTRPFGAKQAIAIFLLFMLVMLFASYLVTILIAPYFPSNDLGNEQEIANPSLGAILILQHLSGLLLATLFTICLLKRYFPGPIREGVLLEIGFIKCDHYLYYVAAFFGFFLSLFFARVLGPIFPPDADFVPNPLMSETQTGDWIQYLTVFTVVLIGPTAEEFLYRGVLYRGFTKSWGNYLGGFLITIIFVLLHNETLSGGYWISIVALVLNAVLLLLTRIFIGSIIPSIFMHIGMNLALMLPQ